MRALVRRAHLTSLGAPDDPCDGRCDGRPESHDEDDQILDDDGNPALSAWPGGEVSRVCIPWAARAAWVGAVMRAVSWSNAGQHVGALDAQTPCLADGLLMARGEWSAIQNEEIERARGAA